MQNVQSHTQHQATPLVSFILTDYNLPVSMVRECIDSIRSLSLSAAEREIILIDDGSAESPLPQLTDMADELVYIRSCNRGLSEARNTGLRMAQGQFVQFVDADDYLVQAPYEHCLDIVRYGHADMVMFDFTSQPDATATYDTSSPTSGRELMHHSNLKATACCYLFRRSILGELRFTPGIFHEDEEFTPLLLLRAEQVVTTTARAYFYRQREHSIMTTTETRQLLKRLNDTRYVLQSLSQKADTLPTEERTAMQRRIAQLTMDYIYNIILQTQNRHFLERKLGELRQMGLFPLPDRDYTLKYQWFRRLTNTSVGLTLLMRTLPLMNKER